MSFEKTSIADFQIYHPSNPNFFKPRGNMFTYRSITQSVNYNFGGTDTSAYPTDGVNLAQGGASPPDDGVYVVPKTNQVMYVDGVKIFFNHTAKSLFSESYKDRISTAASNLQIVHSGVAICSSDNAYSLTLTSDKAPTELADALTNSQYFYSMSLPLNCPGRLDGDSGESFGFKTAGGNGIYLGASFAANQLTHLHFQFTGWVVDKVLIGQSYYEAIPR